jgi:hypothetical protein
MNKTADFQVPPDRPSSAPSGSDLALHTPEPWQCGRYSKPDGTAHETNLDVAETLKFSALHSERAELYGASAVTHEGDEVITFYSGNGPRSQFNAMRVVVCVNACAGLSEEQIVEAITSWRAGQNTQAE